MALNELLCLAESRIHSDAVEAWCLECAGDHRVKLSSRIEAVQHVKTTRHRVWLTRSYVEELYPKPKPREAAPT